MNKKQNKQINKQRKKQKIPGTTEFQSQFKFWCYSSSIQSWCLYLNRSSVVVLPGGWVVVLFFLCLSEAAAWSVPPSLGCGSLSLYVVLRFWNQLCSPPAVPALELGFHCAWLLGACFFALLPFSWARSVLCQPTPCYQPVVMVCWLFFNFAVLFDFGCCSLAQEIGFVDHYLPYFRQWLITCMLLVLLPFQTLFTEMEISFLPFLPSLVHFQISCPLFCVLVCSSLFIV
jgi:hypothetical protein